MSECPFGLLEESKGKKNAESVKEEMKEKGVIALRRGKVARKKIFFLSSSTEKKK